MGDLTTVDGLKAELLRAVEHGDAARAAALYEPGARLLPPGAGVITGEDAVREFFEKRFAAGSEQLLDSGKYLAVFRRQPDGTWRWATDMWNSDAG